MKCSLNLSNYAADCAPNIGGVKAVWAASRNDVVIDDAEFVAGANRVALTRAAGVAQDVKPFKIVAKRPALCSYTVTPQYNDEADTLFYRVEVGLVLNGLREQDTWNLWELAAKDPLLVVEDMNGRFWLVGVTAGDGRRDFAVRISGGSYGSGTQKTDRNGFDIVMSCDSPKPPSVLDDVNQLLEPLNP